MKVSAKIDWWSYFVIRTSSAFDWSISTDLSQSVERVGIHRSLLHCTSPCRPFVVDQSGPLSTILDHYRRPSGPFWTIVRRPLPERRHVTILDHSGPLLSILRAPQRYLNHAEWGPSFNSSSRVPFMSGPAKRANHIIGVAKMREFRVLGTL